MVEVAQAPKQGEVHHQVVAQQLMEQVKEPFCINQWLEEKVTEEYLKGDDKVKTTLGTIKDIKEYQACLVFRPTPRETYGVLLREYLGIASIEDAVNFNFGPKKEAYAFYPLGLPEANKGTPVHDVLCTMMQERVWKKQIIKNDNSSPINVLKATINVMYHFLS